MSTNNIPFSKQKKNHSKSVAIRFFSKGLKNEFKTAVVKEPSGFKPSSTVFIMNGRPIQKTVMIQIVQRLEQANGHFVV